jgi:hypothetical protein
MAISKNQLLRAVEYGRRLVALAYEAWGGTHDTFESVKMEWQELRLQLHCHQANRVGRRVLGSTKRFSLLY